MSVELLISPRISFSHDIDISEHVQDLAFSSSSSSIDAGFDFDFAFSVDRQGALIRESSTADELFSDGKLLPVSINFAHNTEITDAGNPNLDQIQSLCFETEQGKKEERIIKSLKDYLDDSTDFEEDDDEEEESPLPQPTVGRSRTFWNFTRSSSLKKQSIPSKVKPFSRSKSTGGSLSRKPIESPLTRSFWKTKRSNSLDCDEKRAGIIGSLKVILSRSNSTGEVLENKTEDSRQLRIRRSSSLNCQGDDRVRFTTPLGRSHSTGSALNSKRIGIHSEKSELQKQSSTRSSSSSSCSSKKGQGRRSFKDYYANFYRGERVNPVLNLPSPYISRASVDLLGFGSLFCNGRHKKKRR